MDFVCYTTAGIHRVTQHWHRPQCIANVAWINCFRWPRTHYARDNTQMRSCHIVLIAMRFPLLFIALWTKGAKVSIHFYSTWWGYKWMMIDLSSRNQAIAYNYLCGWSPFGWHIRIACFEAENFRRWSVLFAAGNLWHREQKHQQSQYPIFDPFWSCIYQQSYINSGQ